ncbi:hypothetical protein EZV62_028115 [Acer yangbiense]|uniref:Uncharacterized protein n=1 Tax=Acer yangbiense TaxID=1000413 RepID=A0A5C7GP88_9ROSI|nr:hypothetical protein EZV62_028115 [Acer yangbiense]
MFTAQRLDATQAVRRKKVQELVDYVHESCRSGSVVDIGQAAFTTIMNSVSNTLFSIYLAHYQSDLSQNFNKLVYVVMEESGKPNIADYFPFLQSFDPQGIRKRITTNIEKLLNIFDGIIDERILTREKTMSKESKDLLDSLLNLAEENSSQLSLTNIKHLLLDLFLAGTDTTTSTVEWAMVELLHNPEKLTKAQTELRQVLGKDGLVQEFDIAKLPYLQAIKKETLRLHPPGPFLIPHKAETEVEMCSYVVPKSAQVLVNVWAMGRDSSVWQNPTSFMPERFLESEIDVKGRDFELIPFGAGRRICPGLPLAQRMVHLMLASLLYTFDWKLAHDLKPEDMDMTEKGGGLISSACKADCSVSLGEAEIDNLLHRQRILALEATSTSDGRSITTIVISSSHVAKEALQTYDKALSSRTIPDGARSLDHHKHSIAWLPVSAPRRNLRKVCATQMFTAQRIDATQAVRRKKVQELVDYVHESCRSGSVVDIGQAAFTTVMNSVSNTLFSTDLAHYKSDQSQNFNDLVCGVMEEVGTPSIADYFPVLRSVDPQGIRKRITTIWEKMFNIFDGIIHERIHAREKMMSKESRDLLDSLLNLDEENSSDQLNLTGIKHLRLDLFFAGTDTTSSTVEWAMAELLHNPEKLTKAQTELRQVLGKDGLVQEFDIAKLPYLQAIMKETLRFHPPGPFLIPHKAETEVEMCSYVVPKSAQVLVNVWAMGRDSKISSSFPLELERGFVLACRWLTEWYNVTLASLLYTFDWKLAHDLKPEYMDMTEKFGLTLHKSEPLLAIPIKVRLLSFECLMRIVPKLENVSDDQKTARPWWEIDGAELCGTYTFGQDRNECKLTQKKSRVIIAGIPLIVVSLDFPLACRIETTMFLRPFDV